MDGIFSGSPARIEEIKSSFNIYELQRRLQENRAEHPYVLQLRTYGYFHWRKTGEIPDLTLLLVSSRDGGTAEMRIQLDVESYESWLRRRLDELATAAIRAEKRARRRKKSAAALAFPFERPRSGQRELIRHIETGLEASAPLLLQAPTGLGKTVGVLYPVLRDALARGQQVVYVTPKNSQHAAAEDAVERLQARLGEGGRLRSMTLTAKSRMCFKNEPVCNPDFCEFAKDHYTKVAENNLPEVLARKRSLNAAAFKKIAADAQVCPFEIQLDAVAEADTVICDYNYVFAPRSPLSRMDSIQLDQEGKPNLILDEVHNLPSRAMDYYSPSLSVSALHSMRDATEMLPKKFRPELQQLLDGCIATVRKCAPQGSAKPCRITPPLADFLNQDAELRNFLGSYLKSGFDIQPGDVVLNLSFYWTQFTEALEFVGGGREEFFTTYHPDRESIRITCCDPSRLIADSYDRFEHVVGFSATIKPFEYYLQLSGLRERAAGTAEFQSPFDPARRKLLIIPQVSSKYSERERNYPRIAEAIARIAAVRPGNYFAFFPSFDFLNRVFQVFRSPEGFTALKQTGGMNRDAIEEVLNTLREARGPHIVFAVQGGVFSEGVDYPGEMAVGAFVVGPPLPTFDLVREEMRDYYQKHYGAGYDYAYTFPAMAKAVQAAGRVIRTETDKGLIVLMDDRFLQPAYSKSMPADWFGESPNELVSKNILNEVREFWEKR